jgi:phage tail sheath protein FI
MAETLLSPGVLARENDQSQITQGPVTFGAAIIGPAAKGPVEIPTLVTSFSQYTSIFGGAITSGSNVYSYLTSISANNYFQNGGTSLLVTRVTSGSFTPATSSNINGSSSVAFVLETISEGEIMNTGTTELASGSLATGSSDNVRWEIASANTASGTFSLLIRRGDDNNNQKVVLESYNNLSLDPFASNYISKVIGDIDYNLVDDPSTGDYYIQETGSFSNASRYVRVKSVNTPTPNYFDNTGTAKSNFTGSIPVVASGSFGGAVGSNIPVKAGGAKFYNNISSSDTQGLIGSDYNNAIALLSNQDEYQYNVISAPGLIFDNNAAQITSIVNNSISRGDSIAVIDLVNYNAQINTVIGKTAGFDNSYATTYWPWVQTIDPNTGEAVFVPASTMIPGIYAFTDASSEPWFAPAGITRGGLGQVIRAERKLTAGNRDALYEANINPIATFPSTGVVVFGQKTLQKRASALDRVNVRRLLIALKGFISQIADTLVFEQNTIATRNNFLSQVNPYLESVQQRQGLYAFKVVMDDTNNTPDVIDRNELLGQIFIQPTKTAEFIILDFNVLPTGATFPS